MDVSLRSKAAAGFFVVGKLSSIASILTLGVGITEARWVLGFAAACILVSIGLSVSEMRSHEVSEDLHSEVKRLRAEILELRNLSKKETK